MAILFGKMKSPASVVAVVFISVIAIAMVGMYWYFERHYEPSPSDSPKPVLTTELPTEFTLRPASADVLGIDQETSFLLTSSQEVDEGKVKGSLAIAPAVTYDITTEDNKNFTITPDQPLTENTVYTFAIATATDTEQQDAETYSWAYQTKRTFKVTGTLPAHKATNVPVRTGIEVTFSNENYIDYENYFDITPETPGHFERYKKTLVFVPDSMQAGTVYTVTIKKGLPTEGSDEVLAEDTVFKFETEGDSSTYVPRLRFEMGFYEYIVNEAPVFSITNTDSIENLEFNIWKFSSFEDFEGAVKGMYVNIPYWAGYSQSTHSTATDGLELAMSFTASIVDTDSWISFIEAPTGLERGYYLVETFQNDKPVQTFLQVTNMSAAMQTSITNSIIWAHNAAEDQPLANVAIGYSDDAAFTASTGADGSAVFQTPAPLNDETFTFYSQDYLRYFTLTNGDEKLIVPTATASNQYWWVGFSTARNRDYWGYIYPNRQLYLPGDTVHFWGFAQPRGASEEVSSLTVKVFSSTWNGSASIVKIVDETSVVISDIGTFEGQLQLKGTSPGGYSLGVYDGDELIASSFLNVETYTKPPYKLEIVPRTRAIFSGDQAIFDVSTTFFDGTPVPAVELEYSSYRFGDGSVITDSRGKATITFDTTYDENNEYYPQWSNISVNTKRQEVTDLNAYAYMYVFGPAVGMNLEATTDGTISGDVHAISLDAMNADADEFVWDYEGDPMPGIPVTLHVYQYYYEKTQSGTYYDFINKKVVPNYHYTKKDQLVGEIEVTTGADGTFVASFDPEEDKTYFVEAIAKDAQGRQAKETRYVHSKSSYGWYFQNASNQAGDSYYLVEDKDLTSDGNTTMYQAGEQVHVTMYKNESPLEAGSAERYLFFKDYNGISDVETSTAPEMSFTFTENFAPNVFVNAMYFDGRYHRIVNGKALYFDYETKRLTIIATLDKPEYSPGEEVTMDISVTDPDGNPVKDAEVNVSNIDEALAAIQWDSGVNTLTSLYARITSSLRQAYVSHKELVVNYAEGGGCFTGDTTILLADGTEKPIKDVAVGDFVKTRASALDATPAPAAVIEKQVHTVPEYWIINGTLKVTPVHIVWMDDMWKPISEVQIGSRMELFDGTEVTVSSIEKMFEPVTVYNLHIAEKNTFIANGFYVHNEKAGGGERVNLEDVAYFGSSRTNGAGKTQVKFTLPDNITSWLTTVQAITKDRKANGIQTSIIATKPFFVDIAMSKEYLAGDAPKVKIRGFGKAIGSADDVSFEVSFPGSEFPVQNYTAKAFEGIYIDLPDFALGTHNIRVKGTAIGNEDILVQSFDVVDSHILKQELGLYDLTADLSLADAAETNATVTFMDQELGRYYYAVRRLSWSYGNRIDQKMARVYARAMLQTYFDEVWEQEDIPYASYQQADGGYALLPYSSSEIVLTAKLLDIAPEGLGTQNAIGYLYGILEKRDANIDEVVYALYGLASAGEPVLTDINNLMANNPELEAPLRIYIARAVAKLGATEYAKGMFVDLFNAYNQQVDNYIRINMGGDSSDITHDTFQMAVLAQEVSAAEAPNLFQYALNNGSYYDTHNLDELQYLLRALPDLSDAQAGFEYVVNGEQKTVTLEKKRGVSLRLTPEELDVISFQNISGTIAATVSFETPENIETAVTDPSLGLSRSYSVNGESTTTFAEGDIVKITITRRVDDSAIDQHYDVIDYLPAGLNVVTNLWNRGLYDFQAAWPYEVNKQAVKFWANRGEATFSYYAIANKKGTYKADPAVIQGVHTPSSKNFSTASTVTIE